MINDEAIYNLKNLGRIIGQIEGPKPGPCLIFIAGMHGNEPAGVIALRKIFDHLRHSNIAIRGTIIGLAGNLWALKHSKRFKTADLNRLWTQEKLTLLNSSEYKPLTEEDRQQQSLYKVIQEILSTKRGPFYFFDLHTTSSPTKPFLTVNDSLLNRKFTKQYPLPIILGIEEYLEGPLLSLINELGYVSFGFEAGQHEDLKSVEKCLSFIYLSLGFTNVVDKNEIHFNHHYTRLNTEPNCFYEIHNHHKINKEDNYKTKPGFTNFQTVKKGEVLAVSNNKALISPQNTRIFMPLYQNQGDDGFFLIRKIPNFFLWFSKILRKLGFHNILLILPGISQLKSKKNTLVVNLKITRFLAKPLLHLMGYRSKELSKNHLIIKHREDSSKNKHYKKELWF